MPQHQCHHYRSSRAYSPSRSPPRGRLPSPSANRHRSISRNSSTNPARHRRSRSSGHGIMLHRDPPSSASPSPVRHAGRARSSLSSNVSGVGSRDSSSPSRVRCDLGYYHPRGRSYERAWGGRGGNVNISRSRSSSPSYGNNGNSHRSRSVSARSASRNAGPRWRSSSIARSGSCASEISYCGPSPDHHARNRSLSSYGYGGSNHSTTSDISIGGPRRPRYPSTPSSTNRSHEAFIANLEESTTTTTTTPDENDPNKHIHSSRRPQTLLKDDILLTPHEQTAFLGQIRNYRHTLQDQQISFRKEFVRLTGAALPPSITSSGIKMPKDYEDAFLRSGWPLKDGEEEATVLEWTRREADGEIADIEMSLRGRKITLETWARREDLVWQGWRHPNDESESEVSDTQDSHHPPARRPAFDQRQTRTCEVHGYPHHMRDEYRRGRWRVREGECPLERLGDNGGFEVMMRD